MAKKKYSLNERYEYYNKRYATAGKKGKAFCAGVIDGLTPASIIDSSKFKTQTEKDSYHRGVNRGIGILRKSENVKF